MPSLCAYVSAVAACVGTEVMPYLTIRRHLVHDDHALDTHRGAPPPKPDELRGRRVTESNAAVKRRLPDAAASNTQVDVCELPWQLIECCLSARQGIKFTIYK